MVKFWVVTVLSQIERYVFMLRNILYNIYFDIIY
jgi:hypothetical protein